MSSPSADIHIPCCSPATTESVAVVRDKVADARSDVLVGQGHILKTIGDATSAVLRDANGNTLAINGNTNRGVDSLLTQTDKFGLANLSSTRQEADRLGASIDRASYGLAQDVHGESDKITGQASTIAWNQAGIQGAGFAEARAQNERINDAQSAQADRAAKYLQTQVGDSFGRLSAQGENGFYRTGAALTAGFSELSKGVSDSYARLSEQNCSTKETVAAYGNRASDQTATVLATLSAQHTNITRDIAAASDRLGLQAATQYGSLQLEASKNARDIQMQAALNSKESLLEQSKWFALAEKTAMVNKCELESKMAACCCEIKEAVTGTASATQALIQATESNRVRDALSAAATENAILKLRREEHHHPAGGYPYPYPLPYPYPSHHHHHGSRRGSRSD